MKEVIDANNCKFEIRKMPNEDLGYGLYLIRENYPEHLLVIRWGQNECRTWLFNHFVGKKGTKFNIIEVE